MPKRCLGGSTSPTASRPEKPTNTRTERSHEENQERAYIAASRRADRSLEARVQSAKMASEIHKRRTGKGFKITEEIVMKEEMYEEEEDEFPRRRYYTYPAHLSGSSPSGINDPNTAHQAALANLARQQEIDRLFAEQFPNAAKIARQTYMPQPMPHFTGPSCARERTQSVPELTMFTQFPSYPGTSPFASFTSASAATSNTSSAERQMSPEASPAAGSAVISRTAMSTPLSSYSDDQEHRAAKRRAFPNSPADPLLIRSTLTPPNSAESISSPSQVVPGPEFMSGNDRLGQTVPPGAHEGGGYLRDLVADASGLYLTEEQQRPDLGFSTTESYSITSTTSPYSLPDFTPALQAEGPYSYASELGFDLSDETQTYPVGQQHHQFGYSNTSGADWEQWLNEDSIALPNANAVQ